MVLYRKGLLYRKNKKKSVTNTWDQIYSFNNFLLDAYYVLNTDGGSKTNKQTKKLHAFIEPIFLVWRETDIKENK